MPQAQAYARQTPFSLCNFNSSQCIEKLTCLWAIQNVQNIINLSGWLHDLVHNFLSLQVTCLPVP
jgi:hypothetical protein